MRKVKLGDVAIEHKETCKVSKDGYPIVGLEHLVSEEVTLTAWDEGSDNTFTKMFRKGNVLFGRRRAYLKKAAVAPFDGICSGDITVIEAIPDRILPELLPFIIQNDDLFDFAVGKSAGSLSPRVKWEHLKNYEFELPDMDKQRELAELLLAMDATKKSYQKLIAATDELVKSRFVEMFGDITANDRGWLTRPLGELCTIVRGGSPRPIEQYLGGNIPWIKIGDATEGESIYLRSTKEHIIPEGVKKSRMVKAGSLIFANCGVSLGFARIITFDGCIHDGWLALEDVDVSIDKVFLLQTLNQMTSHFREIAPSGTQPNLNTSIMKSHMQIIPPMELQRRFIDFVAEVDKSKFELEQALSELTATYKRIIAENLG